MSEIDKIIRDRADWLVDAVATSTQNTTYLRGDPECDDVACDAIQMNGEKAIRVAVDRAILAERKRCAGIALARMPVTQDMESTMVVTALKDAARRISAKAEATP